MDGRVVNDPADAADPDPARDAPVVLPEPVRLQLITLAAQVLGRLPAEDVPAALRAIARFTPAKRQRLGAAALSAALDADEGFRDRVAAVVAETSPQLVEALRAGAPTPASDPVDVALVAYLTRPGGWQRLLATVADQLVADRPAAGHRDSGPAQLADLRADLSHLRAQLRGEPARVRQAVRQAVDVVQGERDELRTTLRERTRELRAAEREREAARSSVADLQERLDTAIAANEAQQRRHRARLADAGRAAEAARRGARTGRDLDDARLWLLLDTLVRAATGVRRELSIAPPATRPGDVVADSLRDGGPGASGDAVIGRRIAPDVAALDRLLTLPHVHVVVDGYNVTKTGYGGLSLVEQRTRLAGSLAALAAQSGAEVTVAFDGAARPPVQPPAPRGVRVLFSAAEEIADDLIRRLVAAEPPGRTVLVVTSDKQVADDTGRNGAWNVPSAVLLERLS